MSEDDQEALFRTLDRNRASTALAEYYSVVPGHGRLELFGCHQELQGGVGDRLRRLIAHTAGLVSLDPGLLAVHAVAEAHPTTYLSYRPVVSFDVGLDHWHRIRRSIRAAGVVPAGRVASHRVWGLEFQNERQRVMPVYDFENGRTALLAMAAWLKVLENRISAAAPAPPSEVVRFALVRYGYHAGPGGAVELAGRSASDPSLLPRSGPAGASHPLRTATIWAVQAVAVNEDFF